MCIHTISIFSPKKWKSRLEFLKAKQEGRHFWVRKWWIVVMALAMRRGLFSREKKKICEIGRKWEKCIYWFFRRHLLSKGHGNIEIILLKEVNFTVVLLCIVETHLMYLTTSLWYLLRSARLNLYEWQCIFISVVWKKHVSSIICQADVYKTCIIYCGFTCMRFFLRCFNGCVVFRIAAL